MTSPRDIYLSANTLITQYGEDASIHAAMQADMLLEKGDIEGRTTWLRIVKAIDEILKQEPDGAIH